MFVPLVVSILATFLTAFVCADEPPGANVGTKVTDFSLRSATGQPWSLHGVKDAEAVVVVFLSFECPVSNSYAQPLADLAAEYSKRGVIFVGVCTNDETPTWVARQAKEFRLTFSVFKDERGAATGALKAAVTPEAFVLDDRFVLRYRGRIDDAYAARLKKNRQVWRHDLRRALDELLAGRPLSTPVTQAVGCPITLAAQPQPTAGAVTYHRDVVPILQKHCQACHRPGAVAPFSLLTSRQAVNWAADIKQYTQARKMPPWKPSAGLPLRGEPTLSEREIATLAAWVDGGTPEGNAKDAPPPRQFPEGWQLGPPDLVLSMADDFHLGPTGSDLFRCMVLPTNLPEDVFVTAVDVRPGNPRIVHHAVLFFDTSGQARKLDNRERERAKKDTELDRGPGYSVMMGLGFLPSMTEPPPLLGAWAPGQMPRFLPDGVGSALPKGADLVVQMHYNRSGRAEKDRTQIGLYFARKPVRRLQAFGVIAPFLKVPAGAARHRVQGHITVDQDCTLYSVFPHMHLIGKEITVTFTPPDGPTRTLVAIKDWDFNWQGDYFLKEPLRVKAGTRFDIEGFFDNSASNPANPFRPPRDVSFGLHTTNEMCLAGLGAVADGPGRIRVRLLGK